MKVGDGDGDGVVVGVLEGIKVRVGDGDRVGSIVWLGEGFGELVSVSEISVLLSEVQPEISVRINILTTRTNIEMCLNDLIILSRFQELICQINIIKEMSVLDTTTNLTLICYYGIITNYIENQ